MTKTRLEEFRTRWRRWLGQKTRIDKLTWITLLDSRWVGWAQRVCSDAGLEYVPLPYYADRETVKERFLDAINHADIAALYRLDGLYCQTFDE